jgi:capsular exopolysaccharide synthesis family protein
VTSANANEGKTTISVNLAASLAMNGSRVLLIDADLRKPSIHKIMGYPAQPGLSDFLAGYANRTDILRSTSNPNLFIITAGTIPPQPIELLASNGFKELLSGFRKEFEHLIIDAPPILGLADGRSFLLRLMGSCWWQNTIPPAKIHCVLRSNFSPKYMPHCSVVY